MKVLRQIARGVPGHPGNVVLCAFAIMGWIAAGHPLGTLASLAFFGPFYLIGAYDRGRRSTPETPRDEEAT